MFRKIGNWLKPPPSDSSGTSAPIADKASSEVTTAASNVTGEATSLQAPVALDQTSPAATEPVAQETAPEPSPVHTSAPVSAHDEPLPSPGPALVAETQPLTADEATPPTRAPDPVPATAPDLMTAPSPEPVVAADPTPELEPIGAVEPIPAALAEMQSVSTATEPFEPASSGTLQDIVETERSGDANDVVPDVEDVVREGTSEPFVAAAAAAASGTAALSATSFGTETSVDENASALITPDDAIAPEVTASEIVAAPVSNIPSSEAEADSADETTFLPVQPEEKPSMTKYKLEYIWLDGYTPVPNLRGKTQIKEFDAFPLLEQLPLWGFDGSSTLQADGSSSDCVLKPVALYPDPARKNGALVMCEVMMPDGTTPHPSNKRATILDDETAWFGFEQEYFFYQDGRPLGFPAAGYPEPQGKYYTGVGYSAVGDMAREIVEEHLDQCLEAGINHEGINAEVAKGQWEFQIFGKGSKRAADEMWMARYLLQRLGEKYGVDIEYHCKPLGDTDWNGSGMHANFSTAYMREVGGQAYFEALMAAFEKNLHDHIAVYGPDNHMRLTGLHETAPWNEFSYGVADRGASIRVPHSFVNNGYKGYLEDRRPNSQGDPYQIASQILKTISEVPAGATAAA